MSTTIRSALLLFAFAGLAACTTAGTPVDTTGRPIDIGGGDRTISTVESPWQIQTREHLDLWLHGYAMIQDDTARIPLFRRGYKAEMQARRNAANISTQLDANMPALRNRFLLNANLGHGQFLPLHFTSAAVMRQAIEIFIQADGDPRRATSREAAEAMAILAGYYPTGQDRDWLRLFWQSLQEESARFYHDYWIREQANRAMAARAVDSLWTAYRPRLQPYLGNSGQGSGTIFLSLPLNGEGRTMARGIANTVTAVTYPTSVGDAHDAIYVTVHEMMFAAANTAVSDNVTPTEQREGLSDRYVGAAAVRGGLLLLQKTIPSLADGYARYYLRAANRTVGANPQGALTTAFPLPPAILTALTRQLDVVLGGI